MKKLKYSKITLIGMPGVGKTTFGKRIASEYNYEFIDIDNLIINEINTSIHDFIKSNSEEIFMQKEEKIILNLHLPEKYILSTGGSSVYSSRAMQFLQKESKIIFLNDTKENIKNRIKNFSSRGIITKNHTSFESLYHSRLPLYKKYQDITINLPKSFSINTAIEKITKNLI